jgi:hypothetical protein
MPAARFHYRFGAVLLAELRLLLKGLRWWWYAIALLLVAACVFAPLDAVRQGLFPAALIWPVLLWSNLGCREARHDTRQIVFSTPRPLGRQLLATWLAGFAVAAVMGAGAAVKFLLSADAPGLQSLLAGTLFIPSLALLLGVWTGSNKAFEIIYVLLWYMGPINRFAAVDYTGITTGRFWPVYLLLSVLFIILAVIRRRGQLQRK